MDRLKKMFLIIVEILLVAGFIFAVMIYIFPDVFSKKKDDFLGDPIIVTSETFE